MEDSRIAEGAIIGPFARLRPESDIGPSAHVGNFVEVKKTRVGRGSKANHLTYLGDATIGDHVNVGCGTITVNYDPYRLEGPSKQATIVEDEAFIGSGSNLVAPVRVGRNAFVAAGSTITDEVPADALAIARGRQSNKPGWVKQRKAKAANKKTIAASDNK
jgi:bifunctional UDP-N-acetylglucosamine pyrophosphorylase/glucosamine-1-phosphate N-acetyltransferase